MFFLDVYKNILLFEREKKDGKMVIICIYKIEI